MGLISVNADTTGFLAMMDNHHPVTHTGLKYLVDDMSYLMARSFRDSTATIISLPDSEVDGRPCAVWECRFSREPDNRGFVKARLWVDKRLGLAVQLETFDTEGRRYEYYSFGQLKFGVEIREGTFDL